MRPSFGTNLPQTGTHSCQKAFFIHALGQLTKIPLPKEAEIGFLFKTVKIRKGYAELYYNDQIII